PLLVGFADASAVRESDKEAPPAGRPRASARVHGREAQAAGPPLRRVVLDLESAEPEAEARRAVERLEEAALALHDGARAGPRGGLERADLEGVALARDDVRSELVAAARAGQPAALEAQLDARVVGH